MNSSAERMQSRTLPQIQQCIAFRSFSIKPKVYETNELVVAYLDSPLPSKDGAHHAVNDLQNNTIIIQYLIPPRISNKHIIKSHSQKKQIR